MFSLLLYIFGSCNWIGGFVNHSFVCLFICLWCRQERFIRRWVDALSDPRVTHEIRNIWISYWSQVRMFDIMWSYMEDCLWDIELMVCFDMIFLNRRTSRWARILHLISMWRLTSEDVCSIVPYIIWKVEKQFEMINPMQMLIHAVLINSMYSYLHLSNI